jgi:hypothetical protein
MNSTQGIVLRAAWLVLATLATLSSTTVRADCGVAFPKKLQIVARTAPPASIGWSAGLTASAYAALAAAPNGAALQEDQKKVWIGTNFARHHVIPQRYMQTLWQLSRLDTSKCAVLDGDRALIAAALKKMQAVTTQADVGAVIWAPANLFEGPTGTLRGDDPASEIETVRPRSFDVARWTALKNVMAALQKIGALDTTGTWFVIRDIRDLTSPGGLHTLALAIDAIATATADVRQPQPFSNTDWVDSNGQAIALRDLISYLNNRIVTDKTASGKVHAYRLR